MFYNKITRVFLCRRGIMAKLISGDFELSFRITEKCDFDPVEYEFKICLTHKGIPILNEEGMKRGEK